MSCSTCSTIGDSQVGCLNFELIDGNSRVFKLSFTETEDNITAPIDLTLFEGIFMDLVSSERNARNILLSLSLGSGLQIDTITNVLLIEFSETLFNLKDKSFKYDILFVRPNGEKFTYLQGTIKIKPAITLRNGS